MRELSEEKMTREEIFAKVVDIVSPFVKDEEALENVSEDTDILDDLRVNSARLVDVILDFEDEFDIEVEDEAADAVNTVGDAIDLIQSKIS
jgi:acyl carrier protein